jgi:bifunctional non-homologous end joining protein LigD
LLEEYRAKRDFTRTAEPPPSTAKTAAGPLIFCVQKHAARRLHYDFRLEVDGVLKSWPIPNGPSYDPEMRRLAVMTEDHPLEYASFEGIISKGEYGAGQVIVWDAGIYAPEDADGQPCFDRERAESLARRGIERGRLTVFLHGRKLRGLWTLVHTRAKDWLFLKKHDDFADAGRDVLQEDASVLSGLTIEDLKAGRLPDGRRGGSVLLDPAQLQGARRGQLPAQLSPMLPSQAQRAFSHPNWLFEPKLDGYRVMAIVRPESVRLVSRRGLDCSTEYPWLVKALRQQPYHDMVVDGEIVALDEEGRPSFQLLQNRHGEPQPLLVYYAFDLVYRDGWDLRGVRLEERKALLAASLIPTDRLRLVETFPEDGETLYRAVQASGLEGIVAKRRDSRYEAAKRSEAWLKIKATQSDEFVVGGYTVGSGARASTFGSLVVGYYARPEAKKLTYVGHVGSGFDDRTLVRLFERLQQLRIDESPFENEVPTVGRWTRPNKAEGPITWVRPELVAQVKYTERTKDGILRAPVFLGLREDKAAREVNGIQVVDPLTSGLDLSPTGERNLPLTSGLDLSTKGKSENGTLPKGESERLVDQLRQHSGDQLKLEVDGHDIGLSNLNKVFWPAHAGQRALTKRDLLVYYVRVAPYLLPHLRDRPLTLVRYPNGITGQHFYQKHWEQPLPPFVETVRLYSDHNAGDGEYLLCNNLPTLLWLGQVADIELHTWYSRINPAGDATGLSTNFAGSLENILGSVLNYPDFVVFDLDPYLYSGQEARGAEPELHPKGFEATCEVALWLKEILDGLGLAAFVKTTGKTGLHIYVPIVRSLDYDATHTISETLARYLVQQHAREVTTEWAVPKRRGKVFADYNQNVRGKTLASIYSPRVLPWAAVSMPLRWDEVGKVFPTEFTLLTAPDRLARVGDLWSSILASKHDLAGLLGDR